MGEDEQIDVIEACRKIRLFLIVLIAENFTKNIARLMRLRYTNVK